jgi:hypothetical protein
VLAILASTEPEGTEMLSEKYLAGLLDSDGSIQLMWNPPMRRKNWDGTGPQRCYAVVRFDQKTPDQSFMRLIADSLSPPSVRGTWGNLSTSPSGTHYWRVAGTKAAGVLMRLKKFLVNKRNLAEAAIDMNGKIMDVTAGTAQFDAARRSPVPVRPTRKWVAGYIDGNGSFEVRIPKGMAGQAIVSVTDEEVERAGCDLLCKAFGGSVQEFVTPAGTKMVAWVLSMVPSKIRSVFEADKFGVAKHMVIKTDEIYFLLGCAKMGHFRDGERIQNGLRALRSGPHRLSGPGANVPKFLATVRDVPSFMGPGAERRKRQWDAAHP